MMRVPACIRNKMAIVLMIASISGCASSTVGCRQDAHVCSAYGPANGQIDDGTSCAVVVQNHHTCDYDAEGRLKGESVHPGSGVCVCFGWSN